MESSINKSKSIIDNSIKGSKSIVQSSIKGSKNVVENIAQNAQNRNPFRNKESSSLTPLTTIIIIPKHQSDIQTTCNNVISIPNDNISKYKI
jgi:pyruvate/2-oxoacid:ferredoxin oxidoreductase alpha subunit